MKIYIISFAMLCIFALTNSATLVAAVEHAERIEALVLEKKYLTAARYIKSRKELFNADEYFRRYVHILVNYYATTIQYSMFALRDLKPHEKIEDVRGSSGSFEMLGVKLEEQLFDRYKKRPKSPHLNLAIGEFLSRQSSCGCGAPMNFLGSQSGEFQYFDTAYKAGIRDSWQLFRMGYHQHRAKKLNEAINHYQQSLKLDPKNQNTMYNLAVGYFQNRQDKKARVYAKKALGGYKDKNLNSDTYDLYGSILFDAKEFDEAEKHLTKALQLKRWHPHAFGILALLYQKNNENKKYKKLVLSYIANDYENSYLFNRYIEQLPEENYSKIDKEIIEKLSTQKYKTKREIGSVNFNLGRVALFYGDKKRARKHFIISLAAMKKLKTPPPGAIESLEKFLELK